jgi:hypothetical protein
VGSDSRGRDLLAARRTVAWSGADLTSIVSLRDSCEAREARQVLWRGEGCAKGLSVFFNPASFLQPIAPLSPSFHTPHPISGASRDGHAGFRWILVAEEGIRGFKSEARSVLSAQLGVRARETLQEARPQSKEAGKRAVADAHRGVRSRQPRDSAVQSLSVPRAHRAHLLESLPPRISPW